MKKYIMIMFVALGWLLISFTNNKTDELIIGKWKGVNITMKCDKIKGYNGMADMFALEPDFKKTIDNMTIQFNKDKSFEISQATPDEAYNGKYEIAGDQIILIGTTRQE